MAADEIDGDDGEPETAAMDTSSPINWAGHIERSLHTDHDPESHTEPDAVTFHPSQLARCKRQATISKLGLEDHNTATLGIFKTGMLIHEWLEESLDGRFPTASTTRTPSRRRMRIPTGRARSRSRGRLLNKKADMPAPFWTPALPLFPPTPLPKVHEGQYGEFPMYCLLQVPIDNMFSKPVVQSICRIGVSIDVAEDRNM